MSARTFWKGHVNGIGYKGALGTFRGFYSAHVLHEPP